MQAQEINWQTALSSGFKDARALLDYLNICPDAANVEAEKTFKTRVPLSFARRMQPGVLTDPLLMQVLAVSDELIEAKGFVTDPLHEAQYNPISGVIHKYKGRVLLTVTGSCAVNCRYCFRRHFPYSENNPGQLGWQSAIEYIQADESIHEVIFSGGDPLLATDKTLGVLLDGLSSVAHVRTIRIHTRIPVVLPERIDNSFCRLLARARKRFRIAIVLHVNHANELNHEVFEACEKLRQLDVTLLNQSVLLAGINDTREALKALSLKLWDFGVLPYYLHMLDKVKGAQHFDVPLDEAKALVSFLVSELPGYLVPELVRDIPGKPGKTRMS